MQLKLYLLPLGKFAVVKVTVLLQTVVENVVAAQVAPGVILTTLPEPPGDLLRPTAPGEVPETLGP
jgi:hypothetical protein